MLPGVYEFSWDAFHVTFVSFFIVAFVVVAGYGIWATLRARRDRKTGRAGFLRWHETFDMLPPERRVCRHELDVSANARACSQHFDCEHCEQHTALAKDEPPLVGAASVHGIPVLPGDFYGRGHTTVRPVDEGLVEVWPDPLAQILLRQCSVRPRWGDGTHLESGDTAFRAECPGGPLRILTPIGGEIVGHAQLDELPVLRIRPDRPVEEQPHLLNGREAVRWLESEVYRIEDAISPAPGAPTLADGGQIREDLVAASPWVNWDQLREEFLLDV